MQALHGELDRSRARGYHLPALAMRRTSFLPALSALIVLLAPSPSGAVIRARPAGDPVPLYPSATSADPAGSLAAGDWVNAECVVPAAEPRFRLRDGQGRPLGFAPAAGLTFVLDPGPGPDLDAGPPVSPTLATGPFRYVGQQACVTCHRHEERRLRDDPHRRARRTLSGATARAAAAARGVVDPVTDRRCIKCHLTAYGASAAALGAGFAPDEAIGCEACHGPGGDYLDPRVHATSRVQAIARGMLELATLEQRRLLCAACHNRLSPTSRPFDLRLASEAIRHWPAEDEALWQAFATTQAAAVPAGAIVLLAPPLAMAACADVASPGKATPAPAAAGQAPALAAPSGPEHVVFLGPGTDPPARIALFGAVRFPHRDHAQARKPPLACDDPRCHHPIPIRGGAAVPLWRCHDCHPRTAAKDGGGGGGMNAEGAFHASCTPCHKERGAGPRACIPCHAKP